MLWKESFAYYIIRKHLVHKQINARFGSYDAHIVQVLMCACVRARARVRVCVCVCVCGNY